MPDRLPPAPHRLARQIKPVDPFYHSPEWKALGTATKRARRYHCDACGADYSAVPWKLRADHITPIKDGGAPLDPANVQCLCPACDNGKRALEHTERGRGG